jgi:hypothetical protein
LTEQGCQPLAAFLVTAQRADVAWAAVRVLGCDALAPALLQGTPVAPAEGEMVREALRRLPAGIEQPVELRMVSAAVNELASLECGPSQEAEAAHAEWEQRHGDGSDWRALARSLAWLAPMAWPATSTFAAPCAGRWALGVGRGLTRALIRRDFASAARLTRWAALAQRAGGDVGLDLPTVVKHLELCGSGGPVTALHTAVSRHLIAPERT